MSTNQKSLKQNYSIEQKLHVLSLKYVRAVEIAGLMVWSTDKAHKTIVRIKNKGIDRSVPFEPHRYNLDAFLDAMKTTRDEMTLLIHKAFPSFIKERQIEG